MDLSHSMQKLTTSVAFIYIYSCFYADNLLQLSLNLQSSLIAIIHRISVPRISIVLCSARLQDVQAFTRTVHTYIYKFPKNFYKMDFSVYIWRVKLVNWQATTESFNGLRDLLLLKFYRETLFVKLKSVTVTGYRVHQCKPWQMGTSHMPHARNLYNLQDIRKSSTAPTCITYTVFSALSQMTVAWFLFYVQYCRETKNTFDQFTNYTYSLSPMLEMRV